MSENVAKIVKVSKGSPRMFQADWLERLSHVHPATPAIMYLPLGFALVGYMAFAQHAGVGRILLHLFLGYMAWTLFEYWMHRLLFHLPVVGPKTRAVYFYVHGVHHDYPWDLTRLVIPPGASVFFCAAVWAAFWGLFGNQMYGYFAGFLFGYVLYDSLHYYVHAHVPKSRIGKWLRREHMVHHFKEPKTRMGVSCPWLDYVFFTTGNRSHTATADTLDKRAASSAD